MRRVVASTLLVMLSGCDGLSGPRVTVFLSTIDTSGVAIVVPDSVRVDEPFEVRISTDIGGCESAGPTEVRIDVRVVLIPYDVETIYEGTLCPSYLNSVGRVQELSWPTPGVFDVDVRAIDTWTSQPSVFTHRVIAYD